MVLGVMLLAAGSAWSQTQLHPVPQTQQAYDRVEDILADLRTRGYVDPLAVIRRLEAAPDRPGAAAPVEARRRYHAALGILAAAADDAGKLEAARAALTALGQEQRCGPCTAQAKVLQSQWELTRKGAAPSLQLLDEAEAIMGSAPPADLVVHFRAVRARSYRLAGEFARSVADAVAGLRAAEAAGNDAARVELLVTLALDNASLGDFARAQSQIDEAIALAKRIGHRYQLAYAYLNLGHVQSLQGAREAQRDALMAALEMARGNPALSEVEMLTQSNLADYFLYRGDPQRALDYARRAEALARRLDEQRSLAIALTNVGIATARLGRVDEGLARIREAIAIAKRMDNHEHVVGMQQELIAVLEGAGRWREAVAALHEVSGYEKSLVDQARTREVLALQEQFASERNQREITRLSSENARQQALMQARSAQRWMWGALAVAMALAAVLLGQWLRRARRINRSLRRTNAALAEQSTRDPLTGSYNRRHFEALMAHGGPVGEEPANQRRRQPFVSIVMLDLDHFKQVNDLFGHPAGDAVLVAVSARLRALVRQQDAVVRWGGEEFVLVLPGTDAGGAATLVERVLQAVASHPVAVDDRTLPVTVSAGVATLPAAAMAHWQDAVHVADAALYVAKREGRNRAVCVEERVSGGLVAAAADLAAAEAAGQVALARVLGPEWSRRQQDTDRPALRRLVHPVRHALDLPCPHEHHSS